VSFQVNIQRFVSADHGTSQAVLPDIVEYMVGSKVYIGFMLLEDQFRQEKKEMKSGFMFPSWSSFTFG
jgi:hypothetical protein